MIPYALCFLLAWGQVGQEHRVGRNCWGVKTPASSPGLSSRGGGTKPWLPPGPAEAARQVVSRVPQFPTGPELPLPTMVSSLITLHSFPFHFSTARPICPGICSQINSFSNPHSFLLLTLLPQEASPFLDHRLGL